MFEMQPHCRATGKAPWHELPEECLDGKQAGLCKSKNGTSLLATSLSVHAESCRAAKQKQLNELFSLLILPSAARRK